MESPNCAFQLSQHSRSAPNNHRFDTMSLWRNRWETFKIRQPDYCLHRPGTDSASKVTEGGVDFSNMW